MGTFLGQGEFDEMRKGHRQIVKIEEHVFVACCSKSKSKEKEQVNCMCVDAIVK